MRRSGEPYPRLPLPEKGQRDDLAVFQRWLRDAIPQVGSLGIQQMRWERDTLVWELALEPNLNDKGTGFGGGMASQAALIGWCWTSLWLRGQGHDRDVVIAEASQRFKSPVRGDYRLICQPIDEHAPRTLAQRVTERGRGRITLLQSLYCGKTLCLEACGDYVVLPSR